MDSILPQDPKSLPSNPLKDLLIFEERIQHNIHSLQRLRFQATLRIVLAGMATWTMIGIYRMSTLNEYLSLFALVAAALFALMTAAFMIHTVRSRRLTLLGRYRAQCLKMLRIYNLDLRAGVDGVHLRSIASAVGLPGKKGPFLTIKRRFGGRVYDLVDAYRFENWRRKSGTIEKRKSK